MDLQLKGKTAIVTGGASNIGRAISLTLGTEGANVVIADLDDQQGSKTAREIERQESRAICVKTDATNIESVGAMFDQAVQRFGRVDILVNNVGGWITPRFFTESDPPAWEREIALNYRCFLNAMKTILPHMVQNGYGRVVSIGSEAGREGTFKSAIYSGSKAAVIASTKAIAREVGRHNITLNVVCPAVVVPKSHEEFGAASMWASEVTGSWGTPEALEKAVKSYPLRRHGSAQDIANAVVFLVSDAANFITGQTLSVNGGYNMW